MDKKRKRLLLIIFALAILVIPFVGISLALKGPAFLKSLSRIAGDGKHFGHLIILGNFLIIFLFASFYYLYNYYNLGNKKTTKMFIIACILLEITVLTPYIPEENKFVSTIHNYCAYVSIPLLVFSLFGVIFTTPHYSRRVFIFTCISFCCIVIICLTIFLIIRRPSGVFELILITSLADLILIIILLLYHNEKNKIKGTMDVRYKIIKNKTINIIAYETNINLKNEHPLILHETNLNWDFLKNNTNKNPFKKVFVYFDNITKKHYIGVLSNKHNINNNISIHSDKWAVFYLDDNLFSTKEQAWNYIDNNFINDNNYKLNDKIYLEKYLITKNNDIRKIEIWIPIQNN